MNKMYTMTSPGSCWEMMDRAIETIFSAKYPDTSSIVNDRLRGDLTNILGINLNMFDTHRFGFLTFNGAFCSNEYYVYEGSAENIDNILSKEFFCDDITGIYSDGVLAGFFKTEFRDVEYRSTHAYEYFKFIYKLAEVIIDTEDQFSHVIRSGRGAYSWYLDKFPMIYALNRLIKTGVKFSSLYDIGYTFYNSNDTPIGYDDYTVIYCIMSHKGEFSSVNGYYDTMKFLNKHMVVTGVDFYNDTDKALESLIMEYGFKPSDGNDKIRWTNWYCVDFEHNIIVHDEKAEKEAEERQKQLEEFFGRIGDISRDYNGDVESVVFDKEEE